MKKMYDLLEDVKTNSKFYLIITAGFFLAVFQFASNRSLWVDEAKLACNFIDRDFAGLLQPLDSGQMAPILYLLCTKFFNLIFGNNDLALRIFPLLCFLAAIYFILKLSRLLIDNKFTILIIMSLFCLCPKLIYYSSEIKQYMVEVMVLLMLFYFYFKKYKSNKNRILVLSIAGITSIGLANISIIIFFVIGLYTLFFERGKIKKMLIPFIVWILFFAIYYLVFLYQHPSRNLMNDYWDFAFMPSNPFSLEFLRWIFSKGRMVFVYLLRFPGKFYFFVLIIIYYFLGCYSLVKNKKYSLLFILVCPILVHLFLSTLKLYPFHTRIILYQIPLYLITIAIGMRCVFFKLKKHINKTILTTFILLPVFAYAYTNIRSLPYLKEDIKPIYVFMNEHVELDHKLYVYSSNHGAFHYYKKINFIKFNNPKISGESHRENYKDHDKQLSGLTGKVWFVFSHVYKSKESGELESKYIMDYFKDKAETIYKIEQGTNAAYLLDIK